jgi:ketosteroid isomerase-like protein
VFPGEDLEAGAEKAGDLPGFGADQGVEVEQVPSDDYAEHDGFDQGRPQGSVVRVDDGTDLPGLLADGQADVAGGLGVGEHGPQHGHGLQGEPLELHAEGLHEGLDEVLSRLGPGRHRFFGNFSAGNTPIHFDDFTDVTFHDVLDPEVLVVEYGLRGTIAPAGKRFSFSYILVLRVHDGKIAYVRDYLNPMKMTQALSLPAFTQLSLFFLLAGVVLRVISARLFGRRTR